jgi:hypothetical protein
MLRGHPAVRWRTRLEVSSLAKTREFWLVATKVVPGRNQVRTCLIFRCIYDAWCTGLRRANLVVENDIEKGTMDLQLAVAIVEES